MIMKKFLLFLGLVIIFQGSAFAVTGSVEENVTANAVVKVFKNDKYFGLKDANDNIIVEPVYKKMILLGDTSYIVQKGSKFGLIDKSGNILVPIKYSHMERVLGKYLKIGRGNKYALYDEYGKEILPREYSSIDLLFG